MVAVISFTLTGVMLASNARSQRLDQVIISVNTKTGSLNNLLSELSRQSGFNFVYSEELGNIRPVALEVTKMSMDKVLALLSKQQRLRFEQINGAIAVSKLPPLAIPGKITGKVLDEKGEPLPGANIKVVETGQGLQGSVDGSYTLSLAPGTYTLEFSFLSYQTQRVTGVVVLEKGNTSLNISLKPASAALKEVVITGTYRKASIEGLYARQKNNAAMSDGITAEQISRTPDNNTAQVLARVSGLQISQNKFVVIRGMSDRYNNVLLNGSPLPSSEPNRRDFAFDVIPSSLVDNIVVNKTATPDLTGEFTGGLVQITTKDIPDENFVEFNIASGYNSRSTGKDLIGGHRGTANYLGFANDYQRKPIGMTLGQYDDLAIQINDRTATAEQKAQAAKFLSTMPDNWALRRYIARPIQSYQFTAAHRFPFKDNSTLGIVGALTYRNEQLNNQHDVYVSTVRDYKGTDYLFNTLWGGSLNLAYTSGANKFTLKNTYNRRFSDEYFTFTGANMGDNRFVNNYSDQTVINQLFQTNFTGEHTLSKLGIKGDYGFSLSTVNRDQPFTRLMESGRTLANNFDPDDYYSYNFSDANFQYGNIFYSELAEKRYTWQTNWQLPFKLLGLGQSLKVGYQGSRRQADFGADFYRIRTVTLDGTSNSRYDGMAYYDVYDPSQFANGNLYLFTTTPQGDGITRAGAGTGYKGRQNLNAMYGMLDLKPLKDLRLIAGIRYERNEQNVFTRTRGRATPGGVAPIVDSLIQSKNNDWLPSVNAIYALTPKMNIRAAYYKTVARPDFRELSFFSYFDYDLFVSIGGDNLKRTSVKNFDIRYEFYPSPGEILSVSGFRKDFINPIEVVVSTSPTRYQFYKNLQSATNTGFEVDARKSLGFISPSSFLKDLYLSGNFTYINASVDLGTAFTKDDDGNVVSSKRNRPLMGQSPYIVNAGILYTGKHFGFNATFNRFGQRIVYASPDRAEDLYENSRNMVDLQLSYKFMKGNKAELRLNVSNLLNSELFYYRNLFPPSNTKFPQPTPSVQPYPGEGTKPWPAEQIDPKGTRYNPEYDTKIYTWKYGTTSTLNFIYRF
ncbi:TonB-dependent receptor [Mucilaginibacter gynuensis]|uniref:TonB-dependent receptor n=2 Tax=Mucilaginibacter gynuensis TaxID=1302236 RepID=A0ABP8GBK0_9SPHI